MTALAYLRTFPSQTKQTIGAGKRRASPASKRLNQSSGAKSTVPKAGKAKRRSPQWSDQDQDLLKEMRARGWAWQVIEGTGKFGAKTGNACRKKYERLLHNEKFEQIAGNISFYELSTAYMELRTEMWSGLARKVGLESWQLAEKLIFDRGLLTVKGVDREHRKKLDQTPRQEQSQVLKTAPTSEMQTPPLTDDEDARYGHDVDFSSRGTTPNMQTSPDPSSHNDQAMRVAYYGQTQALPVLPSLPQYSGPYRSQSEMPQHLQFQPAPTLHLPAMQSQSYELPHAHRPMLQAPDYTMDLRYLHQPSHEYARQVLPVLSYHHPMTPPTRQEEFSGPKMSVQSILAEPSMPPHSYA